MLVWRKKEATSSRDGLLGSEAPEESLTLLPHMGPFEGMQLFLTALLLGSLSALLVKASEQLDEGDN